MARTRFVGDSGLTARMTLVLFLLGALFVGLIAILMVIFGRSGGPGVAILIGLAGILILLLFLSSGVPIGVSLLLVGLGGLALMISPEAALIKGGVVSFEVISKYELGVLPLFLLMAGVLMVLTPVFNRRFPQSKEKDHA